MAAQPTFPLQGRATFSCSKCKGALPETHIQKEGVIAVQMALRKGLHFLPLAVIMNPLYCLLVWCDYHGFDEREWADVAAQVVCDGCMPCASARFKSCSKVLGEVFTAL